ncbi:MAG: hypothetical protein Q9227_005236 [Pyrenula ochraceoflavens]
MFANPVAPHSGRDPSAKTGGTHTFAAAFRLTEQESNRSAAPQEQVSPQRRRVPKITMHGYNASTDPPPATFVRALYSYNADDRTSLSFRKGDVIQVITQLESGWWDGVINDVRGWFPSNYCAIISNPDDPGEAIAPNTDGEISAESGTEDDYDGEVEEEVDSEPEIQDGDNSFPIEGAESREQEEAAYWIPQATPDGRLFYFNTLTGHSTMELPLETPTSANETGPQDRNNFQVPRQTRPPPEMMAHGYERDEDDYDGSGSEAEGESLMLASHDSSGRKRRSFVSDGVSPATSLDSLNASPAAKPRNEVRDFYNNGGISAIAQSAHPMIPTGTSSTSFSVNPAMSLANSAAPRHFYDDGATVPVTWNRLVENICQSIGNYRRAVKNGERAELVRRAEDISDHLRMLLAAGSGTTDNHSGNPSIISTNKALYPHFRDMMSRFSKLVLSSHMAAADWPAPDSSTKCLQEADGVLNGVYAYVDVARHQRGETIPRLVPGFVYGSLSGANWQNNNLTAKDSMTSTSFSEQDDSDHVEPNATLDHHLLTRIKDALKMLQSSIRRLQEELVVPSKVISVSRQAALSDSICLAARMIIERFSPWIALVESVNLAPLGSNFQSPQLLDFTTQKQKVYDGIAELVTSCQAVSAPLADEWAEVRADSLEDRIQMVGAALGKLDSDVSRIGFGIQLFADAMSNKSPNKGEYRVTDGGETFQKIHRDQLQATGTRPQLGDIGQSQSYTVGMDMPPEKVRRPPNNDKARRFFGQMPPTAAEPDEIPWFLRLDHEGEVTFDPKTDPPQIKHGTLRGLVEQLTRHDRLDALYNSTFLLTYRSFTTASELFEMLAKRFSVQPPYGLPKEDYTVWESQKQKLIRLRVVNILKSWFENYWMEGDDESSAKLLHKVYVFAKDVIATTKTPGSSPLMGVVEQRLKGQDTTAKRLVLTLTNSAPTPIIPKNLKKLKFLDIDAMEFARQLTIIESRLYGKIKPTECLNKTWQKKVSSEEPDPAPNVKALILHSNQLTNWVAELILSQADVKKRVVVIKHFVSIADVRKLPVFMHVLMFGQKARSLNNFSTLTSIVSALGTSPILRLTRTWAQVNAKTNATLESQRNLISSTRNFGEYREKLHLANPPCIPFFGVYLTDLTFIEDGIASMVKNSNLINFGKRAKTADVIRDIQQYQNVPYSLQPVNELQEYILGNMQAAGDVHDMYDRSVEVEPREREEEKITRTAQVHLLICRNTSDRSDEPLYVSDPMVQESVCVIKDCKVKVRQSTMA